MTVLGKGNTLLKKKKMPKSGSTDARLRKSPAEVGAWMNVRYMRNKQWPWTDMGHQASGWDKI